MKNSKKWLSYAPIGLAIVASLSLAFYDSQQHQLSRASLIDLQLLNANYQMELSMVQDGQRSPLVYQLTKTDLLSLPEEVSGHKGLVVTLQSDEFLLLSPTEDISTKQLEKIASDYEANIEEFEYVEVDQDLVLQGEPAYFTLEMMDDEPVVLTTEVPFSFAPPVKVAVIDSGVDVDHEIFQNHTMLDGWNTFDPYEAPIDEVGHGTHVAGILAKNSTNVAIAPYKIVDDRGGRLSNVLAAFRRAIDDDMEVINTSFGLLSPSRSLERLVDEAEDDGIFIISAAGNNNRSNGFYPATYYNTIAVASLTRNGDKMSLSNYGSWVDVAAVGQYVYSALPFGNYGYKSGTSQAAPLVSARVANLLYASPDRLNFENILSTLKKEGSGLLGGKLAGVSVVR
jgi:subtilisin family serine protease